MSRKMVDTEKELVDIFDQVIDRFEEDLNIIFSSEMERKKFLFESIRQKDKNWHMSKKCIVYGCDKPSIIKSHTIQKSGSFEVISENGHVLTPMFDRNTGQIDMSLVGINNASTFPGFCHEHELLFSNFEKKKELTCGKDFGLQIYRTICREMVVYKHSLEYNSDLLQSYIDLRNSKLSELIIAEANKRGINMDSLKSISLKFSNSDYREMMIKSNLKKMKKHLKRFEKEFYYPFTKHLQGANTRQMFVWQIIQLDFVVPVCLAGIGNFGVSDKNGSKDILSVLQVLPFSDRTFVVIFAPIKYEVYLSWYIGRYWKNDLDIVNNIETWMTYGTDHWFIKPSVWNRLLPEKSREILNAIWDTNKNIGNNFEGEIFSDLKKIISKHL